MDDPAHPVGVVVLDHDEAGVAARDTAAERVLDGVGGVDRDHGRDRRHHLASLLLVEVEDAAEHPRLALLESALLAAAVDQHPQLLGRCLVVESIEIRGPLDRKRAGGLVSTINGVNRVGRRSSAE